MDGEEAPLTRRRDLADRLFRAVWRSTERVSLTRAREGALRRDANMVWGRVGKLESGGGAIAGLCGPASEMGYV